MSSQRKPCPSPVPEPIEPEDGLAEAWSAICQRRPVPPSTDKDPNDE